MQIKGLTAVAIALTVLVIVVFNIAIPVTQEQISQKNMLYRVTGETFTASAYNTPVSLAHNTIESGSERVYNATTTFTRGTDYTMDYTNGTITVLSTGSMHNNTQYGINYLYYGTLTGTNLSMANLVITFLIIGVFVVVVAAMVLRWL